MSGRRRPKARVLFLCTGNYYRSRVAEEVFNHLCRHEALDASAFSRGLGGLWANPRNAGPISSNAVEFLVSRGIGIRSRTRMPLPCTPRDVVRASLIIGLDDREHRGMFFSRFPAVHRPIEFWRIGDVGGMDVGEATAGIYARVEALVTELAGRD